MFVFNAYGILLNVDAAASEAASEPGMEALKDNCIPITLPWQGSIVLFANFGGYWISCHFIRFSYQLQLTMQTFIGSKLTATTLP